MIERAVAVEGGRLFILVSPVALVGLFGRRVFDRRIGAVGAGESERGDQRQRQIADYSIADCGLRIADWKHNFPDCGTRIADNGSVLYRSTIRNPQSHRSGPVKVRMLIRKSRSSRRSTTASSIPCSSRNSDR